MKAQFSGFVTILGSKGWSQEQKARFLAGGARRVQVVVNGQSVEAVPHLSKSGNITCAYSVGVELTRADLSLGTPSDASPAAALEALLGEE